MPGGYVSRAEALKILEKGDATIDRYAKTGKVKTKLVPRPGKRAERVYLESDLHGLKEFEERRKEVRPPSAIAPKPAAPAAANGQALAITNFALEKIAAAGIGLTSALEAYMQRKPDAPVVPISEKLWLSLDEAADYSGLVRADLLRLISAGTLKARKSGGWKILRESLEGFKG